LTIAPSVVQSPGVLRRVSAHRGAVIGWTLVGGVLCVAVFGGARAVIVAWTVGTGWASVVSWYRMRNPVGYRSTEGVLAWFADLSRYEKLSPDKVVRLSRIEMSFFVAMFALGCVGIAAAL
jgi:hypothetical protein